MKFIFKIFQLRNIFLFITLFLNIVIAQFQVSPMLIDFIVENNASGVNTVDIRNNLDTQLDLTLYLKDKSFVNGFEEEDLPGTFERSCADWIFFTPSKLSIEPKQSKSIRINMDVPDSAKGTYWAVLYAEESSPPTPRVAEFEGTKINLNINMRVGIVISVTVPRTSIKNGLVESIQILYNDFNLNDGRLKAISSSNSDIESMFTLINQPDIIDQWAGLNDIDLKKMNLKRVNLPTSLLKDLKFRYESVSSPKRVIKLLEKLNNLFDNTEDGAQEEFYKKYGDIIKQLFSYIQHFEKQINDQKKAFVHFKYLNTGNSISKCNGWVEIRDIDGLTVAKIIIDETTKIYPMQRVDFQVPIPKNLEKGEYSALAVIDYGGSKLVAGEIIFQFESLNK